MGFVAVSIFSSKDEPERGGGLWCRWAPFWIGMEGERIVVGAVGMWESRSDFQGRWETRETCFWFSSFSIARHFHSPLPCVQLFVFVHAKLANSLLLACCILLAAAVSLSRLARRCRASIVCPGLR